MLWWFVPVGGLIGAIAAGVASLAWHVLPWSAAATLGVLTLVAVSGGLHLDGFMDACDGLGSRAPGERALEIMKDPNTGAFAVLGCLCLLILKVALVAGMAPWQGVVALGLAPVCGRFMQLVVMQGHAYARPEGGMGAAFFSAVTAQQARIWTLLTVLALACGGPPGRIGAIVAIGGVLLFAHVVNRRLGGHTGDTVGACSELAELLFILGFAAAAHGIVW
jgi:adenosylcobinamide-GDP ribazoletransferase